MTEHNAENEPKITANVKGLIERRAAYEEDVKHPGKFQGENPWIPYYWDTFLSGDADEDDGTTLTFDVSEEDRLMFPELEGVERVYLTETSDGFVCELLEPLPQEEEEEEEEEEDSETA